MSHPSLGLPPRDEAAGFPAAAARIVGAKARLGVRALEIVMELDPTLEERQDELARRALLRDTEIFIERIALAVSSGDPSVAGEFADQVVPVYRRRRVPMDDLINLSEALRSAIGAMLSGPEAESASAAVDAAIAQFRWHRRIAGDARKRNRLLQAIYKGA